MTWGIALIALVLATLFVVAHRAAGLNLRLPREGVHRKTIMAAVFIVVWLSVFGAAAGAGVLARFELRPPPLLLAMVAVVCGALGFSLSGAGARRLPVAELWPGAEPSAPSPPPRDP